MLAEAGSLTHQQIGTGKDPVEVRIVVSDRLQPATQITEHLRNLFVTIGQTPFWEQHLSILGE
ncbi:hypothetical protein D3C85_1036370 [compost metagenome]